MADPTLPRPPRIVGRRLRDVALLLGLVAVVGMLTVPSIRKVASLHHRSAAESNLEALYDAQRSFAREHGRYAASFADLDLDLKGGILEPSGAYQIGPYTYTVETEDVAGLPAQRLQITARADLLPGDDVIDVLRVAARTTP